MENINDFFPFSASIKKTKMNYQNAVAIGGPGLGKCLSDPEVEPCLPPSLRATPSSAPCNHAKALTAVGTCFSQNFTCDPKWDGSTAGLNRVALLSELADPKACSFMNTAVGVLNHPLVEVGDVSGLLKWLKDDLLPCVTGGCYMMGGGNVSTNPYTNLIPENIVQLQKQIEKMESYQNVTTRKITGNVVLAVVAALVVGLVLGMLLQKKKPIF